MKLRFVAGCLRALGAACFFLAVAVSAQVKHIRLRNEVIETAPAPRPAAVQLQAAAEPAVSGLFLLQFNDRWQPAWQEELRTLGVELLRYVPDDAFVARLENVQPGRLRALNYVRWLGDFRPEHKIHPKVRVWQAGAAAGGTRSLSVLLSPRATPQEILAVRGVMQRVERESASRFGPLLRGQLLPAQLAQLAQSATVLWIEPAPNPHLNDEIAAKIVGGDSPTHQTYTQSIGYDGSGVTVAVADSGLNNGDAATMHPDLFGRVSAFLFYGALTDAADEHSHGTHVTGIIAGNGATGETDESNFLYGLGVAPGATIVAQRIFDGAGNFEPPASNETLTRDAVRAGAVIGSNSWGDDTQGQYDLNAAEFDALVRDADALTPGDQPYILEFSAGNAGPGPQTVGSPAVAKNVIATGASQNDRFDFIIYADGSDTMADFSSRGPCEDGRIKPDVVAPGTWIASLQSASAGDENAWAPISDNYLYQGGTSQAGPQVSGACAVFVQYYRDFNDGRTPSPALVKGALINSAVDMDDSFDTGPIPNMDEGWGRVDLTELIFPEAGYEFIDQTNLLITGQTYEHRVIIAGTNVPLKVTLAYTDVPGFPAAIPALVNDLDLEVVGPDGNVYRGNQFSNGESVPNAPTADRINNVEGVRIAVPSPGDYLIRVHARNVVQDARHDTPATDQDFALVLSGDLAAAGTGLVVLDRHAYTVPGQIRLRLVDADLAGQGTATVRLRSSTETNAEVITLKVTGVPGIFTNTVGTATGAPVADGRLQIKHGDLIEAFYDDAGTLRTATARADLVPPVITGVASANEIGLTVVSWQTDEPTTAIVRYGTNTSLTLSVTNFVLGTDHAVELEDLIGGRNYRYLVIAIDAAGNRTTNDNGGALYSFTAPTAATVLLVDHYVAADPFYGLPVIPQSTYTNALRDAGVTFDVTRGSPTLAVLKPYRVVIWRINDSPAADPQRVITSGEQTTISNYLAGGGAFFMASMEILSTAQNRSFGEQVLHVASFDEDVQVPDVVGNSADSAFAGFDFAPDYSNYEDPVFGDLFFPADVSDTFTPSTNAASILLEPGSGKAVGLRYPRNGADAGGRVIFLSFPFDAVPESGPAPNNRANLMRNILSFLAPGAEGIGTLALDSSRYGIPSLVSIELGDSDLEGAGQATITLSSDTDPAGVAVTLYETVKPGVFHGFVSTVPDNSPAAPGRLRVRDGDTIRAVYADASTHGVATAQAVVDAVAPVVTVRPEVVPGYEDATVSWETSEPTDALVQFGESLPLPINRTAYLDTVETSHEVTLNGLAPDKTYYYQIVSRDLAGNVVVDDNGGSYFTFRTLTPIRPPWSDDLEQGDAGWAVLSADYSEDEWQFGSPHNSQATAAYSPVNAWGTSLDGRSQSLVETFLVSPAIELTGGNRATLRFWHTYDFLLSSELDIIHGGELLIVTNAAGQYAVAAEFSDDISPDWVQEEINLTPYLGKVIYLAWHYALGSFDNLPRAGWLVDDVFIEVTNVVSGTVQISNNLAQAKFVLTGPLNRNGGGWSTVISNALPGEYVVTFGTVPFYQTPAPQTNTLDPGGTLLISGNYTFADVNHNGISDAAEQAFFGSVAPDRTQLTDTDHDGMSDYAEFIAGTSPTDVNSKLRVNVPLPQANHALKLDWNSASGHAYRVLGSSNAVQWTPLTDWLIANSTSASLTLSNVNTGAPLLLKLEVRP